MKQGINLIQIFEHELQTKEEIILDRLSYKLQLIRKVIGARKLDIIEINNKQSREFLTQNHLQQYAPSKISYALKNNNEILAVMSFVKTRYTKSADWEMIRFATKKGYSVPGAANRLFKYAVQELQMKSVISSNLNWGYGKLYEQLQFEFKHYSKPNYWYFKSLTDVHSKVKFQKAKLPQELHYLGSEWEIMQHLGWNRYWDTGNAVWIWTKI